ncbi:hypothetical protein GCM10012279_34480 [Micromonospora yangpuensis]|nr:hypothetical protein GCM10012279_34480 [Micromonospora yangpuensis]
MLVECVEGCHDVPHLHRLPADVRRQPVEVPPDVIGEHFPQPAEVTPDPIFLARRLVLPRHSPFSLTAGLLPARSTYADRFRFAPCGFTFGVARMDS